VRPSKGKLIVPIPLQEPWIPTQLLLLQSTILLQLNPRKMTLVLQSRTILFQLNPCKMSLVLQSRTILFQLNPCKMSLVRLPRTTFIPELQGRSSQQSLILALLSEMVPTLQNQLFLRMISTKAVTARQLRPPALLPRTLLLVLPKTSLMCSPLRQ